MLLTDLAAVSVAVSATPSRTRKTTLLAAGLRQAVDDGPDEVAIAVTYLAGGLRQRRPGVGWATLSRAVPAADRPTLTLAEVDATFDRLERLSGPGSQGTRQQLVQDLLRRATAAEQRFVFGIVSGELRQGALAGSMVDAIAVASGTPVGSVRQAAMLSGSLSETAVAALTGGETALGAVRLTVGRPVLPMLAQSASTTAEALTRTGPGSVEWKLDGVRIQVHRRDGDVRVFSRSLDDVTLQMAAVVQLVRHLPGGDLVLDGEAVVLRADGRPDSFQVTASRTSTTTGLAAGSDPVPFFFDLLHRDGVDLVHEPLHRRRAALADAVPAELLALNMVTDDASAAEEFFTATVAAGHEGVVVKSLDAPYEAGRRGASWVKVKPRRTLDLVVLAAEWGHGRRTGWLSNLHLGARNPVDGRFVMLGKTFKGMTDETLTWQTAALLELREREEGHVVYVRPELVVEIAFDGVQTSRRYPGGVALRFARLLRYRPDKRADEADTIDDVRAVRDGVAPLAVVQAGGDGGATPSDPALRGVDHA